MAAEPLFEPVPISDLPRDGLGTMEAPQAAPRRGPGRPPARNADGTRKHAPRVSTPRKGRGRVSAPRPTTRAPSTLYPELVGFLTMVNMGIAFTPFGTRHEPTGNIVPTKIGDVTLPMPEMRVTKLGDELDEIEISVLAQAIDAQCRRSPRVKKYVQGFLGVTGNVGLIGVVGMIAARRLSRHGLIDPNLDLQLGAMLTGDVSALASFMPGEDDKPADPDADPAPNRDATKDAPAFDFAAVH